MKILFEEIKKNKKSYLLFSNNNLEITIAKDFGPRIMGINFKNEINLFGEVNVTKETPAGKWKLYGGHRLWLAPEKILDSYTIDNDPVLIKQRKDSVLISQEIKSLKIIKSIVIKFLNSNSVEVTHKIKNIDKTDYKFSIWALSLMRTGGFAIIPQNRKKEDFFGLAPNRNIVLWPYSDITDNRLKLGNKYIHIKQGGKKPLKIGQRITSNWIAYFYNGYLFTKKFQYLKNKIYPDYNCNIEIYSCKNFLEVETLSPLYNVKPGKIVSHKEIWNLKKNVNLKFGENL